MSTATHTCPQRTADGTDDAASPFVGAGRNKDAYTPGHGLVGQGRGCTYCGSMHPDDFMEAVRAGNEIGPTNKNYKVYVTGYKHDGPNGGKFYFEHLSEEQRRAFVGLVNDKTAHIGFPGQFPVLPFFMGRP